MLTNVDLPYALPEADDLPLELRDSVRRHYRHLAALVASFRAAGIDEAMIEAGVRQLTESYGSELTAAIHALVQEPSYARG